MVIEPLGIQHGNYGVEILAQTSKSSLAQAQQTAQMSEIVQDNQKKAKEIQPSDEVISSEKIHRKNDDEHQDNREREQEEGKQELQQQEKEDQRVIFSVPIQKNGRYDFYI
jgi:Rieske Fe-S protein